MLNDNKLNSEENVNFTNTPLLIRNSALNFISKLIPVLIGIIAIPYLIHHLGLERFGILTIVWVFISYLGGLDLGISKGVTKFVSEGLEKREEAYVASIGWNGFWMTTAVASFLGLLLWLVSSYLVRGFLNISVELHHEAIVSLKLVAICFPIVLATSVFQAILTSYQRFDKISVYQIINGLFNYLPPLVVIFFYKGLIPVIIVLVAGKAIIFLLYLITVVKEKYFRVSFEKLNRTICKQLLGFGGWVTVSNLAGTIMDQIDRYFVAGILTMSVVAFYTTPIDVLIRVGIIPVSIIGVLFPAFSGMIVKNPDKAFQLVRSSQKMILVTVAPVLFALYLFAEELLTIWIDAEFAAESVVIAQILIAGYIFKSLSYIPITFLHGSDKQALVAKVHLMEVGIYVFLFVFLTIEFGLVGAAIAHSLRLVADSLIMNILAYQGSGKYKKLIADWFLPLIILLISSVTFIFISEIGLKIIGYLLWILILSFVCWRFYIDDQIKTNLFKILKVNS